MVIESEETYISIPFKFISIYNPVKAMMPRTANKTKAGKK